jgi:Ca-activated chloride channel family protein
MQMLLNARLDVDVLALQQDDEVTCLLTFEAPVPADLADRPGETLIVVVDRSGSMSGAPLEAVRSSLHALVDRVKPQDTLGVVTFDSEAAVAVPARPVSEHHLPTVHGLIEGIHPGGSTDLTGGYLLGLSEARRHLGATGATVLLLSDGHANAGVTDPVQVGGIATGARDERITSSTIGIGAGYDEILLNEVATAGNGSHRFAFTPDDAAAVVGEEAGDLLSKSIVNAFVRIKPSDPDMIDRIGTLHHVPRWVESDANGDAVVVMPLGDLYSGETRELLVHFDVPGIAGLGLHTLAEFTIDYVTLPDLTAQAITWPMSVNVVPGDEAAGRIPDPSVTTARLLAEANNAKRDAREALGHGDAPSASRLMKEQSMRLQGAIAGIPDSDPHAAELKARLAEEDEQLGKLARGAEQQDAMMASKSFMEDYSMSSRGRSDKVRRDRARGKRDF